MVETPRQIIEQIRRESLKVDKLNRIAPVTGKRQGIRLPGRTIEAVLYPAGKRCAPIIFAFHGGGFVFGGCALDDELHSTLAERLAANVVSVGYRKGEKNPFPRAVDDAYDTVKYFLGNLQGDCDFDQSRIATFGSSAGANLAVTTSILAHRRKEFRVGTQILVYPFLDLATPAEDKGYPPDELTRMRYFTDVYARPEQRRDPLVSPVFADDEDFDRSMHVIVSLADNDPLRAEGELYTSRLRTLGLEVAERLSPGQSHGYFEYGFRDLSEGYCPPSIAAAAEKGSLGVERDATVEFIKQNWERWLDG